MKKPFIQDFEAAFKEKYSFFRALARLLTNKKIRLIYFFRKNKSRFWFYKQKQLEKRLDIEIGKASIGAGFQMIHASGININPSSVIGKNFVIFKGATIGSIRSGKRKGTPKIGDNVVVGINAFVGGGIKIGSHVFIAPNSFVNFDVPNHCIVFGNPGIIKNKMFPERDYIQLSDEDIEPFNSN